MSENETRSSSLEQHSPEQHSPERYSLERWYGSLVAGLLPLLVLGSVASAFSNRVAFAAWAVGVAVLHALALRHLFAVGAARKTRAEMVLLGAWALAAASWFGLAAAYAAPLERGARAHGSSWAVFFFDAPWPVTGVLILLGLGLFAFFRVVALR